MNDLSNHNKELSTDELVTLSIYFLMFLGAADFIGINHYTTNLVAHREQSLNEAHYERDQDIDVSFSPCWREYILTFLSHVVYIGLLWIINCG